MEVIKLGYTIPNHHTILEIVESLKPETVPHDTIDNIELVDKILESIETDVQEFIQLSEKAQLSLEVQNVKLETKIRNKIIDYFTPETDSYNQNGDGYINLTPIPEEDQQNLEKVVYLLNESKKDVDNALVLKTALNESVYKLTGQDILNVIKDEYPKQLESMTLDKFMDILDIVSRKIEIPWEEYVQAVLEVYETFEA